MFNISLSLSVLALLMVWQLATAISIATVADGSSDGSCTCVEGRKVKFGNCREKDAQQVWKKHYSTDVGLYGDCLPSVEEK